MKKKMGQLGWLVILWCCLIIPVQAAESLSQSPQSSGLYPEPDDHSGYSVYGLFFRTMIALLLVIGLVIVVFYCAKRVLPRWNRVPGRQIQVVETIMLGPRKALHLVHVRDTCLLIASTHDRITMLASLKPDYSSQDKDQRAEEFDADVT